MKNKIIYWVATGLVSLMMLFSAYAYFTDPNVSAGFTAMGFKDFFRIELGVAKILGAFVLLIPAAPQLIKEWAYAGFGITFISAFIAHAANADPASSMVMPLVALAMLATSRVFLSKIG
ncbi:DoxX family protein [Algoriphagus sp. D3-2-R+10]|uniref:DoxX family protein n=1 Tax=Algoriphagus aurantiacus TaxID=3103948 RepID=UPI002B3AC8E9|nr:DoxX family protein [Algoriphagus sp. D3-2-R+10]MEB2775833.1 DoxX family protein [Algoriphagus sp. D3-2-R+10]